MKGIGRTPRAGKVLGKVLVLPPPLLEVPVDCVLEEVVVLVVLVEATCVAVVVVVVEVVVGVGLFS